MSVKSQRLLKIYALLKRQPVTVDLLRTWAKKNNIQISERTFYRDLDVLENSVLAEGEELVVTVGEKNKKTWKIEFRGNDKLTEYDINSYLLFTKFLPLPLVESRVESLDRIKEIFYTTYSKSRFEVFAAYADSQLISTQFGEFHGDDRYAKLVEDVLWAIRNHRVLHQVEAHYDITAISSSVTFPLHLLPIKLIYHRGMVHIGGYEKESGRLLILALSQITRYQLSNISFNLAPLLIKFEEDMQKRFGITDNINGEVYDIRLEFSEMLGNFVKCERWHPTQQFSQLDNGNFIMTMRCGINRELVGWIFMWMTNVRVLEPPILRDMILAKYREVLDDYETGKPLVSNNSFRAE